MGEIPGPEEQLNLEEADAAAYAEKPLRDAAREEGITQEEKAVMDKAAERKGKKAVEDFKEKDEAKKARDEIDAVFDKDSGKKIEDVSQEQKDFDKKWAELTAKKEQQWGEDLKGLGDDIRVQAHLGERSGERISIYKDGKHVGDIISDDNLRGFTKKELQDKAYGLLHGNPMPEQAEKEPLVEVGREGITKDETEAGGMVLSGNELRLLRDRNFPSIDLYSKGENTRVDFKKIDAGKILLVVTEKDGKTIEYTIDGGVFLPDSRKVRPPKK